MASIFRSAETYFKISPVVFRRSRDLRGPIIIPAKHTQVGSNVMEMRVRPTPFSIDSEALQIILYDDLEVTNPYTEKHKIGMLFIKTYE